ncbi:RecQ-mediated genome instability protein 1, partial [Lecanoromycetidae sp. Uapishka_2]
MSSAAPQITAQLTTTKGLTPSLTWLSAFLNTQRPTTPIPALTQTACFRLLASDITTSLAVSPQTCLPKDVHNPNIQEKRLHAGPIAVQVLAVEDMSKSRWEQIEAIEALERGEGTKGREIIRVVAAEDDDAAEAGVQKGGGPHKLLLQDAAGRRVYGIELRALEGVGLGMSMGCKMVLKSAVVARGMVLLEPSTTTVLGGKIDALHKAWKDGRKAELKAAIEASEQGAQARG